MFNWLSGLAVAAFDEVKKDLFESAIHVASVDQWESAQFASIFCQFHEFDLEKTILTISRQSLEKEPKNAALVRVFEVLETLAKENSKVCSALLQEPKTDSHAGDVKK